MSARNDSLSTVAELRWPFSGWDAVEAGKVSVRELRRSYYPVYPGVYVPRAAELSATERARAAWLWSKRRGVVAGLSAASVLGAKWIEPNQPAELVHTNRRPPAGLLVHADELAPGETQLIDGMPVTTAARTGFDIGRHTPLTAAVQRIDALMNATDVKLVDIEAVIVGHPGARGLRQLRRTLDLVDGGAESPYESLTRLLLVQAGFPRPETQIPVFDEYGFVVARIDMGWRKWRVGVDFEGAQHWTDSKQRTRDVERYGRLPELGWTDIRLTSGMLHNQPEVFLNRVGAALIAHGCPKTW